MEEYDDTTYGQRIAGVYDQLYAEYDPAAIELLFELAGLRLRHRWGTWYS